MNLKTAIKKIFQGAMLLGMAFCGGLAATAQTTTVNESFTGTNAPGWVLGGNSYTPNLTANGGGDTAGNGCCD